MTRPGQQQRKWTVEQRTATHLLWLETSLREIRPKPWVQIARVWNHAFPPGPGEDQRSANMLSGDHGSRANGTKSRDWKAHIIPDNDMFSAADIAMRTRVRARLLASAQALKIGLGQNPLQGLDRLRLTETTISGPADDYIPPTPAPAIGSALTAIPGLTAVPAPNAKSTIKRKRATASTNADDGDGQAQDDSDHAQVKRRNTRSAAKSGSRRTLRRVAAMQQPSDKVSGTEADEPKTSRWIKTKHGWNKPPVIQHRDPDESETSLGTFDSDGTSSILTYHESDDTGTKRSLPIEQVVKRLEILKLSHEAKLDLLMAAFPQTGRQSVGNILKNGHKGNVRSAWLGLGAILAFDDEDDVSHNQSTKATAKQYSAFNFEDVFGDPRSPLSKLSDMTKCPVGPTAIRQKITQCEPRPFPKPKPAPIKRG